MSKFDCDQTHSHRVINKRFGVEEWWSYSKTGVFSELPVSLPSFLEKWESIHHPEAR